MYQELRSRGLEVVAVTSYAGSYKAITKLSPEAEFAKMREYIDEWELPWPMVFGTIGNYQAYGVHGIPQYVVIDREGRIASITIGYDEAAFNILRSSVIEALNKPAAAN